MTANSTIMKLSPNLLLDCVELLLSFLLRQGWTLHYNLFFWSLIERPPQLLLSSFLSTKWTKRGKPHFFCSDQRKWETLVYTTYFLLKMFTLKKIIKVSVGLYYRINITHSNELGLTIQQMKILESIVSKLKLAKYKKKQYTRATSKRAHLLTFEHFLLLWQFLIWPGFLHPCFSNLSLKRQVNFSLRGSLYMYL